MYKDKNKQREANKERQRRYRSRRDTIGGHRPKGVTKGASVIPCDTRLKVIPEDTPIVIPCEVEPAKPQSYNPMMVGYVPPRENKDK